MYNIKIESLGSHPQKGNKKRTTKAWVTEFEKDKPLNDYRIDVIVMFEYRRDIYRSVTTKDRIESLIMYPDVGMPVKTNEKLVGSPYSTGGGIYGHTGAHGEPIHKKVFRTVKTMYLSNPKLLS
jgi:hypothetical protein